MVQAKYDYPDLRDPNWSIWTVEPPAGASGAGRSISAALAEVVAAPRLAASTIATPRLRSSL
jgi:hypothetical protein